MCTNIRDAGNRIKSDLDARSAADRFVRFAGGGEPARLTLSMVIGNPETLEGFSRRVALAEDDRRTLPGRQRRSALGRSGPRSIPGKGIDKSPSQL
jgi:hypothetical protein